MFIACNFVKFMYLVIGKFLSPSSCQVFAPTHTKKNAKVVCLCTNVQLITKLNLVSVKQACVSHETTIPKFQERFQVANAEQVIFLFSSTTFSGQGLGTVVGDHEGSLRLRCWLSIYHF